MRTKSRTALVLLMSSFGSGGGIAEYGRSLLSALLHSESFEKIVCLNRYRSTKPYELPSPFEFLEPSSDNRGAYLASVWSLLTSGVRPELIICGHIYLLPIAVLFKILFGGKIVLVMYGIEVWTPPKRPLTKYFLRFCECFISCSQFTLDKFFTWAKQVSQNASYVVPGAVDLERFSPGEKNLELLESLDIEGKDVLFTLARLNASERYKGIDEVIEALPELLEHNPSLAYLIGGDGSDRERLEKKAQELDVVEQVKFLGYVPEECKPDYYRLSDLFVMAGTGEGFGIVYLEALACGVPVVGSTLDASSETLLNGELGILVDPKDKKDLVSGIRRALQEKLIDPEKLDRYSTEQFYALTREILGKILRD